MNTIKCEALVVVIAILLALWLIGGCKEAVAPIQPVQTHHHGEQEDPEEARRKAPPPPLPKRPPPLPGMPSFLDMVDDLDEALKLVESSDLRDAGKGIRSLGGFLTKGATADRRAVRGTLREILLYADDPSLRSTAAQALSRDFEQTYPLLLRALNDKDTKVLTAVLHVLSLHDSKPSLVRRVRELLNHPEHKVSAGAVSALVEMYGHSKNVTGLINLLGVYEHDLSASAAIRLTVMGRETVPKLIHALKTSANADQRHGAALVLAMICGGASPKQQKFAEMARSETRAYVQKPVALPLRKAVEPLIDALLRDDSVKVREISAQGLGYLGDKRAAPALAEALAKDPSAAVRRRAAAALITVPARSVRRDLEKAARSDESEAVRRYAAEALGWIGSPVVVPVLIDITEDEEPEVRRYAAVELGRLAEEGKLSEQLHHKALLALVRLFDDESSDVRWAAVMSVGQLRDKAAVGLLAKALDDPVPMVSHAAERGLQKMGIAQRKAEEFKKYYD
ncbi:MAG: HEAT repeat domain-containing protein [Armatimonadetes bacterium]|nr:HEAT repeat domain-containing protein [Armatimonadota bacterium]